MASESQLEPLCEKLEWQLLRYLREMEGLREKRRRLEALMEQGWFSLSKARYSMGNKWVSSLQYGPEMVPLAQVDVSLKEDGRCYFQVERVDSGEMRGTGAVQEEQKEVMEIGAQEQVRRRKARLRRDEDQKLAPESAMAGRSQALNESTEEDKPVEQRDGRRLGQDPIRWFGILVPQSLKIAQASFKEVMEIAADVATLQSSLLSTKEEYQTLLRQKGQVMEQGHVTRGFSCFQLQNSQREIDRLVTGFIWTGKCARNSRTLIQRERQMFNTIIQLPLKSGRQSGLEIQMSFGFGRKQSL
ncbi:coiled-coil domain-containing protein 115-like isoform X2 [Scyliorhinus torazame]|uniref:coiled-coil domain-containing protein 115-like isoform X2 n=1 Tax=Scyliorhinus torazame TaxID=75743 RepID=UPI003B5CC63D